MPYSEEQEFALWQKYEDVAMHFNGLVIKLRTQALGGIAAIITLSGLSVNFVSKSTTSIQWVILAGTFVFLLLVWVAIWIIDMQYYNRLLQGAVRAIIECESKTEGRITLSTTIERQFGNRNSEKDIAAWPQRCFYLLVAFGLIVGAVCCSYLATTTQTQSPEKLEYRLERTPADTINLQVSPTAKTP